MTVKQSLLLKLNSSDKSMSEIIESLSNAELGMMMDAYHFTRREAQNYLKHH